MIRLNVYDFDGTIYDGDSTLDFYRYCLLRQPGLAVYGFRQALGILRWAAGRSSTAQMKEAFFSFLPGLAQLEDTVAAFWDARQNKLQRWYLDQREDHDVVISASPDFLLRPICQRLGIPPPIATQVDPSSGRLQGRNCKGPEKVLRFQARYPGERIQNFYSDSLTDAPLAALAEAAFLVKKTKLRPWPGQQEGETGFLCRDKK